ALAHAVHAPRRERRIHAFQMRVRSGLGSGGQRALVEVQARAAEGLGLEEGVVTALSVCEDVLNLGVVESHHGAPMVTDPRGRSTSDVEAVKAPAGRRTSPDLTSDPRAVFYGRGQQPMQGFESPRLLRRPFRLSHAAMA